jgi:hypothetical protein
VHIIGQYGRGIYLLNNANSCQTNSGVVMSTLEQYLIVQWLPQLLDVQISSATESERERECVCVCVRVYQPTNQALLGMHTSLAIPTANVARHGISTWIILSYSGESARSNTLTIGCNSALYRSRVKNLSLPESYMKHYIATDRHGK